MYKKTNSQSGFTLIELLVVIAIIAILASVIMGYVYQATSKGRDSQRKQNIDQIVKAVNFYFSDNGHLPGDTDGWCTYISNPTNGYGDTFTTDLVPYIKTMPLDPTKHNQVGDYLFSVTNNNSGHYSLCANLENDTGQSYDYSSCTGGAVYNYCLTQ